MDHHVHMQSLQASCVSSTFISVQLRNNYMDSAKNGTHLASASAKLTMDTSSDPE